MTLDTNSTMPLGTLALLDPELDQLVFDCNGYIKDDVGIERAFALKGYEHEEGELHSMRLRLPDGRAVHACGFRKPDGRIRRIQSLLPRELGEKLQGWGMIVPFAGQSQWISTRDHDGNIYTNGLQIGDAEGNLYREGRRVPDSETIAHYRKKLKFALDTVEQLESELRESERKLEELTPKWKRTMTILLEQMNAFLEGDTYYMTDEGVGFARRIIGIPEGSAWGSNMVIDHIDLDDESVWQRVADALGIDELTGGQQ